jgi:hypothetical protein
MTARLVEVIVFRLLVGAVVFACLARQRRRPASALPGHPDRHYRR